MNRLNSSSNSWSVDFSALLLSHGQVQAATFTNSAFITINDRANASPYPSTISVSGMVGSITKVTVTLNGLTILMLETSTWCW